MNTSLIPSPLHGTRSTRPDATVASGDAATPILAHADGAAIAQPQPDGLTGQPQPAAHMARNTPEGHATTRRPGIQSWSAIGMLVAGVTLSAAGFCIPPVGEISDSVLWLFAQCLLYAGSIFGVRSYVDRKMLEWQADARCRPHPTASTHA